MPRGVRKASVPALPAGVSLATWVPILVIPSGGHSAKADGTHLASARRQTGNSKVETEVRLRYQPCCEAHKEAVTVPSLASLTELQALCTRLTQHHGHGRLLPQSAHIAWEKCAETVPCHDCLEELGEPEPEPRRRPGRPPKQVEAQA